MFIRRISLATVFFSTSLAYGSEIYKWTDENGMTHFSDSVTESQKKKAHIVNSRFVNVITSPPPISRNSSAEIKSEEISSKEPPPHAQDPSSIPPDTVATTNQKIDCLEEWKKYRESQDCFAPYRVVRRDGRMGIRAEAFNHCTEVKQPEFCK